MRITYTKFPPNSFPSLVIFWQTKKLFFCLSFTTARKKPLKQKKKNCGWYCNGRWRHLMNSIILINVDKYSFLLVQFLALLCVSCSFVWWEMNLSKFFGKTSLFMHQAKKKNVYIWRMTGVWWRKERRNSNVCSYSLLRVEKILKNDIVKDILCRLKLT